MKKLSKKLSLIVCLAMIANLFVFSAPVVSAADSEVLYKSSFSDYTSNGTPKGWIKTSYVVNNGAEVENTTSYAYAASEQNHNNVLKFDATPGSVINEVIPFGKVVSDGKLHISFDHKVPAESYTGKQSSMIVALFNMNKPTKYRETDTLFNNYDPNDLYDFRGTVGHQQSHLVRIPYYNTKDQNGNDVDKTDSSLDIKVSKTGLYWTDNVKTGAKINCNEWNHFDFIVDLDNNVYDVWLDGKKITNSTKETQGILRSDSGYNQFKGFSFIQQDGNFKKGLYDNIAITHYTANDTIQMVADAGKNGIGASSADGKLLNVAFNDSFSDTFRPEDFEIKDSDGNKVEEFTVLSQTKSDCVLDFSAATGIKGNTNYTVTYTANGKGIATEVSANGASATFRTNAATVDTSKGGYKYYYSKEDFNGYTKAEQLPFGFYDSANLNNDQENTAYNKYLSKAAESAYGKYLSAQGKDGNALKLVNSSTLYHFFPRGVVAGDFTMEFDVNYKIGGWSIGLIPYRSWENALVQNKLKNGLLNNNRYINALIGMSTAGTNSDISSPNLAICNADNVSNTSQTEKHAFPVMDNETTNVTTGLTVASDEWTHIKLDFDMAEGNVDIYVTDANGNETKALDQSYGNWNKFGSGVDGVVFYKGKSSDTTAEVKFDNFEVYSTSGKLLNEDFNGYTAAAKKRFPYFWISNDKLSSPNINSDSRNASSVALSYSVNAYSTSGKTGESNDNAVKFTGTKKSTKTGVGEPLWYTTRFEKNVPAGQSYAVEFDLKYEDADTVWVYGPVDSTRVTSLMGYNDMAYSDSSYADYMLTSTNLIGMAKNNLYYYKHYNQMPVDANVDVVTSSGGSSFYTALTTDSTQNVNTWKHYKIVAVPQESNTKYIVTVDGNEYTFTDNLKNNTKDIAGIAFQIRNKTNFEKTWGISLDNVSAYLCDALGNEITTARENSILDIEAEKLNGDTVSLMNTNEIPYSTSKITVTFSEDLDETLKKDLTPISIKNSSDNRTGTVTGIYDCIEDVIQLRSKNAAYPMDYDAEISGNKFIITLKDALTSDTTYALHIAKDVSFASSPYSTLDKGFSRTYTGAIDPDGGFKLTSCKAVVNKGTSETPSWTDVTAISDIQNNEANLGLKFNVTNVTGSTKNIRAIAAFYNADGTVAKLVNVALNDYAFESQSGAQEQVIAINVPTLTEGNSYSSVKFFAWDADTQAPLKKPQEFKTAE